MRDLIFDTGFTVYSRAQNKYFMCDVLHYEAPTETGNQLYQELTTYLSVGSSSLRGQVSGSCRYTSGSRNISVSTVSVGCPEFDCLQGQ
jgi:hypothetical protein